MLLKRYPNLQSNLQKNSSILWILVNTFGFYIANINYCGKLLQNKQLNPNLMLIYILVISPLFSGFLYGLFQLVFFKITHKVFQILRWGLMNSLSFFLINFFNGYLLDLFLSPIFSKMIGSKYTFSSNLFTGNVIMGGLNIIVDILMAVFIGIFIGLWSGFVFGYFPSRTFLDKKIAKEWTLNVMISFCISFVINSIFYTVIYNLMPANIHLGNLYKIGFLFTGFMFGFFTRNTVKKMPCKK